MATTLRKQREVQQRELHFLDVARKLLISQGYAGLNLDRLAEATEYSKGTVHKHFSTREELVTALAAQTMERRVALFEKVARFPGRPRERMEGLGIADEIFARLYPQSFHSELIIKMADLEDRVSAERTNLLRGQEARCLGFVRGFIEEAIRVGDLPASTPASRLLFAVLTLVIGTHTVVSNFRSVVTEIGIEEPFSDLRSNIQIFLDGFGWQPLATEWDYAETHRRILTEVFPDESRIAGLR